MTGLVCTVGGSPAPILAALRQYQPDAVLFVCSEGSASAVQEQILPQITPRLWRILRVPDEQDLLSCVTALRDGIEAFLQEASTPLLADFTGGTKVMSAALVLALMQYEVQFTYTGGGLRHKDGLGTVQDGQERILPLVNPWKALAWPRIRRLADQFNAGLFSQAAETARRIADQGVRPALFAALSVLARAYAAWDGFRHREALALFDESLPVLEREARPRLRPFVAALAENRARLAEIVQEPAPDRACLADLAANALRCEQSGRHDDAVARLYSILEKTAKIILLRDYNLDTSNLDMSRLPESFLAENPPLRNHEGLWQIPLFRSWQLLASLGHEQGRNFLLRQDEVTQVLYARNNSLLAHGFAPVSADDCARLRAIVFDFLQLSPESLTRFPRLSFSALS